MFASLSAYLHYMKSDTKQYFFFVYVTVNVTYIYMFVFKFCQVTRYVLHTMILHEILGPRPLGPKEIDGLLVPPGKAYTMLTG